MQVSWVAPDAANPKKEAELDSSHVGPLAPVRGAKYNFLTFTKPNGNLEESARRRIRSQVLKNFHADRKFAARERQWSILEQEAASRAVRDSGLATREKARRLLDQRTELITLNASSQASSDSNSPSPLTYLPASLVDPFSSTPFELSENDRLYLHRYLQFQSDLDISGARNPGYKAATKFFLPEATKDTIMLYSGLYVGARGVAAASTPEERFNYTALIYKERIIQAINRALNDQVKAISNSTLLGILHLAIAGLIDGDYIAYHLHAKAMRQIVGLRGGLHTLGMQGWLADVILEIDKSGANRFASQQYYMQAAPLKKLVLIDSLNTGFLPVGILSNFSEELIGILNHLSVITDVLCRTKGILSSSGPVSWASARECERGLQELARQRKTTDSLIESPDIHICTIWAAELYYAFILYISPPSAHWWHANSMEFLETVSRLLASRNNDEFLDLLFWVSFMGSLNTQPPDKRKMWWTLIARIAACLNVTSWEDAALILKCFLWRDPHSETLGKGTWFQMKDFRDI